MTGRTKEERVENLETAKRRRRGLPRFVRDRSKGDRKYYYVEARGHRIAVPAPDHPAFPAAYEKAVKGLPPKHRKPRKEIFKGSGMAPGDLHPYMDSLQRGAMQRAKLSGREYDLPRDWCADRYLAQKGRCALSNMVMRKPVAPWDSYGPSIDRIDSARGYTPDNCQLTLLAVNTAKSHLPQEDFIAICQAIARGLVREKNAKRYARDYARRKAKRLATLNAPSKL